MSSPPDDALCVAAVNIVLLITDLNVGLLCLFTFVAGCCPTSLLNEEFDIVGFLLGC